MSSSWNCEKIVIRNEKRGEWTFPCNQWFDSSNGDKKIVRDLLPSVSSTGAFTLCNYTVAVKTGGVASLA